MFKSKQLIFHILSFAQNSSPIWHDSILVAALVLVLVNVFLKFEGQFSFWFFDDEVWKNCDKKIGCLPASKNPREESSVSWFYSSGGGIERSAKLFVKKLYERFVRHAYSAEKLIPFMNRSGFLFRVSSMTYSDPSLAVEESCQVFVRKHSFLLVSDGMSVNSVKPDARPGMGAEGQYRAKQKPLRASGACREQGLTSKEKVCSDPVRNRGRSHDRVNIHPFLRSYNTKYVHFYVDPLMFFRWTEPRTWPNQVLDIRLLLLRLALVFKSRMFLAVIDGFTA